MVPESLGQLFSSTFFFCLYPSPDFSFMPSKGEAGGGNLVPTISDFADQPSLLWVPLVLPSTNGRVFFGKARTLLHMDNIRPALQHWLVSHTDCGHSGFFLLGSNEEDHTLPTP